MEKIKVLIYAPIRWLNAECAYILSLVPGLMERGMEIVIMASPGNPILEEAKKLGIRVEGRFDLLTLNPIKLSKTLPLLKRWLEQERFDIIDVHRSEGFALIARLVNKLNPKPCLVRTRQDMRPARSDPINRRTYHQADLIITSNQLLAEDLKARLKLPDEKLAVIYFGIDPEEFKPTKSKKDAQAEFGIDPNWRLIGLSARLAPVKGHKYFLECAEIISERVSEARFLVSYRIIEPESDFLSLLEKSPIKDKFLLFGPCQERADLLNLCEVGVLSSVGSEASSRACLEWMALKKPVVASRVGVLPELIIPAETGYLVMPRDSKAMAEAILKLLSHPERAREMGEQGYKRVVENFTKKKMIDQTYQYFSELVKRARGGL